MNDTTRATAAPAGSDQITVFDDAIDLLSYRRDCSVVKPGTAEVAAQPGNADEVAMVIADAMRASRPVYVRGGGTMYAGGANPHAGGTVIDLGRMNRVLELDLARGIVVVEAGIRFADLLDYLEPHGRAVGIVPSTGPAAAVGGAVSSHALGTGSPRHQSMGDCVAGLEVILADGTRLRTGSAACPGAGLLSALLPRTGSDRRIHRRRCRVRRYHGRVPVALPATGGARDVQPRFPRCANRERISQRRAGSGTHAQHLVCRGL